MIKKVLIGLGVAGGLFLIFVMWRKKHDKKLMERAMQIDGMSREELIQTLNQRTGTDIKHLETITDTDQLKMMLFES